MGAVVLDVRALVGEEHTTRAKRVVLTTASMLTAVSCIRLYAFPLKEGNLLCPNQPRCKVHFTPLNNNFKMLLLRLIIVMRSLILKSKTMVNTETMTMHEVAADSTNLLSRKNGLRSRTSFLQKMSEALILRILRIWDMPKAKLLFARRARTLRTG